MPGDIKLEVFVVHNIDEDALNLNEMVCRDCKLKILGEKDIIEQLDRMSEMSFVERNKGSHRYIKCTGMKTVIASPQIIAEEIAKDYNNEIIERDEQLQINAEITSEEYAKERFITSAAVPELLKEIRHDYLERIKGLYETQDLTETGKLILEGTADWLQILIEKAEQNHVSEQSDGTGK